MTPRETTVAASVVADMLQYLADRGIPTSQALAAARLNRTFAESPDHRVPGSSVEKLWQLAVEQTGDTLVGLHMGESYNPGALDIFGYVMLNCSTVGEVLERFARYAPLLNDGLQIELIRGSRIAYCKCSFVDGIDNYLLRAPQQPIDTIWAGVARELRRLPISPVYPTAVWFRHAAPPKEQLVEYERVIGAPMSFGAAEDRFVLSADALTQPLRSANPDLLQIFERHAETVLRSLQHEDARVTQVARVLTQKLKGNAPPLQEVARHMAMSSRNLQRVLRESGTSYQTLLDQVRRDLAIQHLANPGASVGQIGFLLGFSEPSAFHRAFRRWTGKAPSAYRAMMQTPA
jgi:AraC-like DNA-binding protein